MTAFLSYSSADKKLAERLQEELQRQGVSVWSDGGSLRAGSNWVKKIEEAIHSVDDILVLVGPNGQADEAQRFTWQETLQAVWENADKGKSKRMIPILIEDAKVPTFVYSSGAPFQAVRIDDTGDLEATAKKVADLLSRQWKAASRKLEIRSNTGNGRGTIPDEIELERAARLSEIRRYAESLKARG